MTSPRDLANAAQLVASQPGVSAFVAASAGSGKTKLLTDRLLRLLLGGAEPARIQCLTFTKAAAAEMALRLQRVLGRWVTLDDGGLDAALRALEVPADAAHRTRARALFALVLDLPGGMRIGTIHAFCQSLLRRFPLEARISPHFRLMDDIDAGIALGEAREAMLAEAHTPERRRALEALAGLVSVEGFGTLVGQLRARPRALAAASAAGPAALLARLRRVLGARESAEELTARAVAPPGEAALRAAARVIAEQGSPSVQAIANQVLGWLSCDAEDRAANWDAWLDVFLTKAGKPRASGGLVNARLAKAQPDLLDPLVEEQARVIAIEDQKRAVMVAEVSAALVLLAAPVAESYAAAKQGAGLLDYDDLIARSSELLDDPGAAWVLYKLDGGLDHLLLDEVQDTAPAQWAIAGALAGEFFAGAGARPPLPGEAARSVFAVGDRKQSIYSFQGADPDGFELWRGRLRGMVTGAGLAWEDVQLQVSFRSTAPVLRLVDAVFADPLAAAGVAEAGTLAHLSDRGGHGGVVELWPLAPLPVLAEPEPWAVPSENRGSVSAMQALADALAGWIADQLRDGVMLESRGRRLAAGDVLVLVRRRNAFATALVRALKGRGVAVAGLDRLVLTEQPAVADLLALCDVLLLPEDDLALGCVLTSPLGGVSDDSLMALAAGRPNAGKGGTLWEALGARQAERAEWGAAWRMLNTLLARVDYVSPHALLVEALGVLGGRARLFARLGPEAAEPVDELLAAALRYAAVHPPGLQGFLHWLRQSGAEVKREAEGAGGAVRIMTVHGAKGLQAPLVIVPDTTSLPPDEGAVVWAADPVSGGDLPVWSPRKEVRCAAVDALRAEAARLRAEEYNRLLYVALTRAEDRLLVCGWRGKNTPPESCWYELVRRAFLALGAAAGEAPFEGEALRLASPQRAEPVRERAAAAGAVVALPGWVAAAPPVEPALPVHLAPSRPENIG
ncbi:MAG TPA: double-strand break repair helicase AddA, partial [Acetobacteraceae bacterium]|nr:double-strand break repair helicase AddA [Acetobacteraceae bacterium]